MPSNISCTSPNSKKAFMIVVSGTVVERTLSRKQHMGNFFSDVRFLHEEVMGGFCKYGLYHQLSL